MRPHLRGLLELCLIRVHYHRQLSCQYQYQKTNSHEGTDEYTRITNQICDSWRFVVHSRSFVFSNTKFTNLSFTTMTFWISFPCTHFSTAGSAEARSRVSPSESPRSASKSPRVFPFTCTIIVTRSPFANSRSKEGHEEA